MEKNIQIPKNIVKTAIKFAKKSNCKYYKHSAVIFKGKRIIHAACNLIYKTHPNGSGPHTSSHAEVRAIIQGIKVKDLTNTKILIVRINRQEKLKNSKPCKDCMKLINRYKLRPIWSIGDNTYNEYKKYRKYDKEFST